MTAHCPFRPENGLFRSFGPRLALALILALALLCALAPAAFAADAGVGHGDPFAPVFEALAVLLVCAVAGRFVARRLKQSPVLGELVVGILIGAVLYQAGGPAVTIIRHLDVVKAVGQDVLQKDMDWKSSVALEIEKARLPERAARQLESVLLDPRFGPKSQLAQSLLLFSSLGAALLLFMVGLECSVAEMRQVGGAATRVGFAGVIMPALLGWLTALWLTPPGAPGALAVFVGASLCATSIGITARVFKDMNMLAAPEAKVVLAAAVLDDVLGLVVLAVVTGIATTGVFSLGALASIVVKAALFLAAVVVIGQYSLRRWGRKLAALDEHARLLIPFALLMLISWMSDSIGLAAIVGAFAAGLIIEESYFAKDGETPGHGEGVAGLITSLEGVFAPIFFVLMGLQVDIMAFLDLKVLLGGLLLSAVGIATKVAAGWLAGDVDKLTVGIGLVPRGEVGLIFASIGKAVGVLDSDFFTMLIIVVLVTTLITPPLLTWAWDRKLRGRGAAPGPRQRA